MGPVLNTWPFDRCPSLVLVMLLVTATALTTVVCPEAIGKSHPIKLVVAPGSPVSVGGPMFAMSKFCAAGGRVSAEADLAVSLPSSGTVAVLLSRGKGRYSLARGSPFPSGGLRPSGLVGLGCSLRQPSSDIAVANAATDNVSYFGTRSTNKLGLIPGSPFSSQGSNPTAVGIVDDNFRDSYLEGLAVANAGSGTLSFRLSGGDRSSDDDNTFTDIAPGSPFVTGLMAPSALAIGDLNGDRDKSAPYYDGPEDIALVDSSGASAANVAVLFNGPGNTLRPANGSPFQSGGARPTAVATGDFNDDRVSDLAIANFGSDNISVLLSRPGGRFAPAPGSPFSSGGLGPNAITSWDLNRDGWKDLAVTNAVSNSLSGFVGDGHGGFQMSPGFPISTGGITPTAIVVGNMDGDESWTEDRLFGAQPADLAIAHSGSQNVSVFLNKTQRPTFLPRGRPRVRPSGVIAMKITAPAAGVFAVSATARNRGGGRARYGCGFRGFYSRRTGKLVVIPTRSGLRLFNKGRRLEIELKVIFLRSDEHETGGDVGSGRPRGKTKKKRKKPVIVHVSGRSRTTGTISQRVGQPQCAPEFDPL
jgi:hypothetical protein